MNKIVLDNSITYILILFFLDSLLNGSSKKTKRCFNIFKYW